MNWVWRNLTTGVITQTFGSGDFLTSGVSITYPDAPADTLGSLRTVYESTPSIFPPVLVSVIAATGWEALKDQPSSSLFVLTKHSGQGITKPLISVFVGSTPGNLVFSGIKPFIVPTKENLYGVWYDVNGSQIGEILGILQGDQVSNEFDAITKSMTNPQLATFVSLTQFLTADNKLIIGYFGSDLTDLEVAICN